MARTIFKLILLVFVGSMSSCLLAVRFLLPRRVAARWRRFLTLNGSRLLARIFGMRVHVQGRAPQEPYILVSNHLSYMDILLLMTQLDGTFISKKEVRSWPGIGLIARIMGTIFIDREKLRDSERVNALIRAYYESGEGVIFFPEGTSSKGSTVLRFSPVLLAPAARQHYPVHYVSIRYVTPPDVPPAPYSVCWWGDMKFWPHLKDLLKIHAFDAYITFGAGAIAEPDPRTLAERLQRAVLNQFKPTDSSTTTNCRQERGDMMGTFTALANDNIELLKDLQNLINDLNDDLYQSKPIQITSDPAGAHVRHVLEHYTLFIDGLEERKIDYDQRKRDLRISDSRLYAGQVIDRINAQLRMISPEDAQKPLSIKMDCGAESLWSQSSLHRELQFLVGHHMHHNAIIRMILESQSYRVRDDFGYAPSTLKYKQKETHVHSNVDQ